MSDPTTGPTRPPHRPFDEGEERADPFGWLYRDEPGGRTAPQSGSGRQPGPVGQGAPPPVDPYGVAYSPPPAPDGGSGYPGAGSSGRPAPDGGSPSGTYPPPTAGTPQDPGVVTQLLGSGGAEPPPDAYREPVSAERRSPGPVIAVILIAVLLVVALIGGALVALHPETLHRATAPPTSSSGNSASSEASASGGVYTGEVAPITATDAMADCVAPDGVDGAGKTVPYKPTNVIDEDPSTAWRCDGDGIGQQITVALPGSTVAQLGFVNGYAKIDPADGSNRYPEYRRILEVEWRLSNGATFTQTAKDGTEGIQTLAIPVQHDITSVSLVIKKVTAPGLQDKTRDAVLISTIQISAPA